MWFSYTSWLVSCRAVRNILYMSTCIRNISVTMTSISLMLINFLPRLILPRLSIYNKKCACAFAWYGVNLQDILVVFLKERKLETNTSRITSEKWFPLLPPQSSQSFLAFSFLSPAPPVLSYWLAPSYNVVRLIFLANYCNQSNIWD